LGKLLKRLLKFLFLFYNIIFLIDKIPLGLFINYVTNRGEEGVDLGVTIGQKRLGIDVYHWDRVGLKIFQNGITK
jgi:hypothetical protein